MRALSARGLAELCSISVTNSTACWSFFLGRAAKLASKRQKYLGNTISSKSLALFAAGSTCVEKSLQCLQISVLRHGLPICGKCMLMGWFKTRSHRHHRLFSKFFAKTILGPMPYNLFRLLELALQLLLKPLYGLAVNQRRTRLCWAQRR